MGWDVVVFGSLKFPKGELARWLDAELRPGALALASELPWLASDDDPICRVGEQLALWAELHASGRHRCLVELAAASVAVTALLPKEELLEHGGRYFATFARAVDFQARGTIRWVGIGTPLACELDIGGGRSSFVVREEEREDTAPVQRALARLAAAEPQAHARASSGRPSGPLLVDDATAASLAEVHGRLGRAGDNAFANAARRVPVDVDSEGAWWRQRGSARVAELRAALVVPPEVDAEVACSRHRSALVVLAQLEGETSAPLLVRLVAPPTPIAIRWGAAHALAIAGARSPDAVTKLLAAFSEPDGGPLRAAAAAALGAIRSPLVGARMLRVLEEALAAMPSEDAEERAVLALRVLAAVGHSSALDAIRALSGHSAAAVRREATRAARALERSGG